MPSLSAIITACCFPIDPFLLLGESESIVVRACSACGAEVELSARLRSATCAFCDSALVDVEAQEREPIDSVVPFSVTREQAGSRLTAFLSRRWFAPEAVRRLRRPDELSEVLVPFHVFDAVARSQFSARVGIYWYRKETYTVTVNGKTRRRTRRVRETEWFTLTGSHVRQWFDHLVSASRGLSESYANKLEPYDLGEAIPYAPSLLAGLTAEHATVPKEEARKTAAEELARLESQVIAKTHLPGDRHSSLESSTQSDLEPPRLVLLPVWIAVVKGPEGPLRILVNGQTGEVVSDPLPMSMWKVAGAVFALLVVLGFVAMVLLGFGTISAALGSL